MKRENYLKLIAGLLLSVIAIIACAPFGVLMADAAAVDLPETNGSDEHAGHLIGTASTGTSEQTDGELNATIGNETEDELYQKDIDEKITKIRPMATPIDQITRQAARKSGTNSMEVKYYSVGTKPIKSAMNAAYTVATAQTANTVQIDVVNPSYFGPADTIRVAGVKGYKADGTTHAKEDLVLSVVGIEKGKLEVYAVNGTAVADYGNVGVPAIAKDTVLVRLGKACAETDAQAAIFSTIPSAEVQYCQIFMAQVEESTLNKMWSAKEVNWNFNDLEEASIYDMKVGIEGSYLFGAKGVHRHPNKAENVWFTGGIWWMAGKDYTVGTVTEGVRTVKDDDMVDLEKKLFTGTGAGNKRKVMFCGSEFLAALMKMKSDQYKFVKENNTVEKWGLRFKSFDSEFGEIYAIHHELFDLNDKSDEAFVLDPEFLTKRTFMSWSRNVLDLKKAGIRNASAVVLQEISCVYLTNQMAHARLKLAPIV